MSTFKCTEYKRLNEENVTDYVRNAGFFSADEPLEARELSDGNINYVFRVSSKLTGKSVIVKQAARTLRSNTSKTLTENRICFEVRSLRLMDELVPGSVPQVFHYDGAMKCCVMEDLKAYSVMRSKLMEFETYDFFPEAIAAFMAQLHFYTSDFYTDAIEKKNRVREYINPELCRITEQLVYTEPYTDFLKRNFFPEELSDYIKNEFYEDTNLHTTVASLKYEFLTSAQALVHGDLHTGSIFIDKSGCKVFDSEFAFYGPCGYDVGCLVGNLVLSYLHAHVVGKREIFCRWLLDCINAILRNYESEFLRLAEKNTNDLMLKNEGFAKRFVNEVTVSSIAIAGIEMIRRTIGKAKVAEISEFDDEKMKLAVSYGALFVGKKLLMNPEQYVENIYKIGLLTEQALIGQLVQI
jgi:5-methylthioribose kinase